MPTGVGGILLAGGSGSRFGQPKQFLEIAPGVRLVDAALATTRAVCDEVVVVVAAEHRPALLSAATPLAAPRSATQPPERAIEEPVVRFADPGMDRIGSVRSGLRKLSEDLDVVLVHDAAHPLATEAAAWDVINAVRSGAAAAVPWLPVVDVLKRRKTDGSLETVGRDGLGQAQTPHGFDAEVLRRVHSTTLDSEINQEEQSEIPPESSMHQTWEDTQLIESLGLRVVGVSGDPANIHVVTPADLEVARRLARCQ